MTRIEKAPAEGLFGKGNQLATTKLAASTETPYYAVV